MAFDHHSHQNRHVDERVAIAGCRVAGDADPDDLYPDRDFDLLRDALSESGIEAVPVSWDHPDFDWGSVAAVLVRSTWDSVDRPKQYLCWARAVSTLTTVINPAEVIEWGLDKTYLQDLADAGIPVVPTEWVTPGADWKAIGSRDVVIKPSISAGGRDTAWYGSGQQGDAEAHAASLLAQGHTVMIQPYLLSVSNSGEIDLVYIDGRYSHSIRKGAVLERGAGVQQRPWERMTWLGVAAPDDAELALADAAMAVVGSRFGRLAYGRVDVLDGPTGQPMVLEVELIDANLSLTDFPEAASSLAKAAADRLST